MELLQFVFSSFWVWLGCVVLIVAAGEAVATAAAEDEEEPDENQTTTFDAEAAEDTE